MTESIVKSTDSHRPSCRQSKRLVISLRSTRGGVLAVLNFADPKKQALPEASSISFGRYSNASHFRDGLFSDIYKAWITNDNSNEAQETSRRCVALKVTYPMAMQQPHNSRYEVLVLQRAASPCVIPLLDQFHDANNHHVLVFPFVPYNLQELLAASTITKSQGNQCLQDISAGLAFVHERGIIHRDIKPANILVMNQSGHSYLADFGIAWSTFDSHPEPAQSKLTDVGTGCYRAPEILFGFGGYDKSVDIWAIGCVAVEILRHNHESLFDTGEAGSDLALVHSIFQTLGTPTPESWPEVMTLPDWGKVDFHIYPAQSWGEVLSDLGEDARSFVASTIVYESKQRLTAVQVLNLVSDPWRARFINRFTLGTYTSADA